MNAEKLFRILGIQYKIRHSGSGIIYTVKCPYCSSGTGHKHHGNSGAFLIYNERLHYTCFRGCYSPLITVLKDISGCAIDEIKEALSLVSSEYKKEYHVEEKKDTFTLPENIGLTDTYKAYLQYRGFDNAEELVKKHSLLFTPETPYVYCGMNMSKCIVFPIYDGSKPVSFVARSVSPTSVIRYLFPPNSVAKDYGWSTNKDNDFVCIVEGTMDAMKLNSVDVPCLACLGINYTHAFVTNIVKRGYKKICVLFDPEPQAQSQQIKLVNELNLLIPATTIQYPYQNKDLGDCTYGELLDIKKLIEEKLKKI
jgi:hypothetical protein